MEQKQRKTVEENIKNFAENHFKPATTNATVVVQRMQLHESESE